MEDGEEDGPFDVKLEPTCPQELLEDASATGLFPETLEDESRPDVEVPDDGESTLLVSGEE